MLFDTDPWYSIFLIIGAVGSTVFVVMKVSSNQTRFTNYFRENIVQNMIKSMDSSILYEPKSYFYLRELMYSGLIETAPNVYEAENYFEQKKPNYTMEVAWAYAFKQTDREVGLEFHDKQQAMNRQSMACFINSPYPNRFKTNVIIRQDKEKGLRKLFEVNPDFLSNNFFYVEMAHEEFEKEFQT